MTTAIPRIDLSGTPYEIGLSHGRLLSKQILSQIDIYRDLFQETCQFDWSRVLETAQEFYYSIERLAPHLLEEMRGIADGVGGIGILDIIAINARSEIALGQWDDGCTSLAWGLQSGELSTSGRKQILAQNWDWRTSVGKNLVLVSITQANRPKIWMVVEPGIVGKIGFNSSSVGVCLNAIRARPISSSLLPIHLLLRISLECDSINSAISAIEHLGGAASSQHILIADAAGSRGLELSPRGGVYLEADADGILVHTNHFLQNKLVDEPPWLTGSPIRLERIRVICRTIQGEAEIGNSRKRDSIDPALLRRRIFSDTVNSPQAICCSPDPARNASIETLFNIVMTFTPGQEPTAEVLFGKPINDGTESEIVCMPW